MPKRAKKRTGLADLAQALGSIGYRIESAYGKNGKPAYEASPVTSKRVKVYKIFNPYGTVRWAKGIFDGFRIFRELEKSLGN